MTEDAHHQVRSHAKKARQKLHFTSEELGDASNFYVAWLDLMGAGHLMATSVHKSANFLIRLHMAVDTACRECKFQGRLLPINDGIYIVSPSKREVMELVRHAICILAEYFISTPRPQDRFLMRAAVAFGPVYFGSQLANGLKRKQKENARNFLKGILFGPPIIQAYKSESASPPYGVTLHESARAFSPNGDSPFRMTHWLWWHTTEEAKPPDNFPPLTDLKDCLFVELGIHFAWMKDTLLFHGISRKKVESWYEMSRQYFSLA